MEKDCDLVSTLKGTEYIRALSEDGSTVRISVAELGKALVGLIPMSYSGWTGGVRMKLTKGSCCFMLEAYGSAYIVVCIGEKGASVSKLGGDKNIEFREDSSGNVYAFVIGIYFIQRIGCYPYNIIAEEISDYPPDCTTLVVK